MATIKVAKNIDSYTCHRIENCNLREFYIHAQFFINFKMLIFSSKSQSLKFTSKAKCETGFHLYIINYVFMVRLQDF